MTYVPPLKRLGEEHLDDGIEMRYLRKEGLIGPLPSGMLAVRAIGSRIGERPGRTRAEGATASGYLDAREIGRNGRGF